MAEGKSLIEQKILHVGRSAANFTNGSKVFFHFQTKKCSDPNVILDDSRKDNKPIELVLGKKFKLEVWEAIVQKMGIGEVSSFTVDKSLLSSYPIVAKTLRDARRPDGANKSHHCCGMMSFQNEGLGYPDLNELIKEPQDLEFIIELIKVEGPEDYKKEAWQLNEDEKLQCIPRLRSEGNKLVEQKKYSEACSVYSEALHHLEQLMLKEKPGEEEYNTLDEMKIPLLLNYAQCKLMEKDYYPVIEHCSTVLQKHPENIKALFRRAKAHVGAWNPKEAREDFLNVIKLDPSLTGAVNKELQILTNLEKSKYAEDKKKFEGKMFGL